MNKKYIITFVALLIFGSGQAFAWIEYQPVIFVGNISDIYSKMPVFHGYTQEFLSSQTAKQVCQDASQDGVTLNYCK